MTDTLFARVAQDIAPGSRLARSWELKGGVSAQVTALEIERSDGERQTVVVRRHGPADLAANPQVAAGEFRLLGLVRAAGVAAPAPLRLDQSGRIFPAPYLVIEYVAGEPAFDHRQLRPALGQMAAQLARIHAVAHAGLDFLPRQRDRYERLIAKTPATFDQSLSEERIRAALAAIWPFEPRNRAVLLHGDFWPNNLLWRDNRLVAVLDWEDAAVGDPLADLANTRMEILWAFGPEAMDYFTEQYRALTAIDWADLPRWELCAALWPAGKLGGWGLEAAAEQSMRERHRWFVGQAFARLESR
ncbi:MAG TPA: phosphotransferase [Herpetosiphonaceae bacterium]|nr:phosphotransferase [Herpetosiphonaceae bacterium]